MKIVEKRKCSECNHFEWEDEFPDCTFGINAKVDIDDFFPLSIHPKNKICSHPTIEVRIKFNGAYDGDDLEDLLENINWLCPENIRLILRKECPNTEFEVSYSKRYRKRLLKYQKLKKI